MGDIVLHTDRSSATTFPGYTAAVRVVPSQNQVITAVGISCQTSASGVWVYARVYRESDAALIASGAYYQPPSGLTWITLDSSVQLNSGQGYRVGVYTGASSTPAIWRSGDYASHTHTDGTFTVTYYDSYRHSGDVYPSTHYATEWEMGLRVQAPPNLAPNAPTLGNPAADASVDASSGITFSWTHSDPEGDAQNGYSLRRRINGTTTWYYWTGSTWTTTQTVITTSAQSVAIGAAHWTDGEAWEWSVATRDPGGLLGAYATERDFTVADAVPTVTASGPADNLAVALSGGLTFSWSFNDPNDSQSAYSLRRRAWGSATQEYWTGTGWTTTQTWVTSTSTSVTVSGAYWPADDSTYYWSVAVKDNTGGTASAYTAERVFNPWEFWNGTAWAITETAPWVTSTTDSAQVAETTFVSGSQYQWSAATKDAAGQASAYASPNTFTVGGVVPTEGWGRINI